MITSQETLPNSRLKITHTATVAQFRHAFEHALKHAGEDVKIPGFRAGKAPAAKVIQTVGRQRIEADALDHVISDVYFEDIRTANLVPVEGPKVEVETYVAPAEGAADTDVAVTFTAEVDILPEVDVTGYKDIKIKAAEVPKVDADEVERVIEYLRKQQAKIEEAAADATLQNGMWADLAYEGSVDGVSRDDMKNKNHPLVIGEGQLIPGFEDQIIGLKAGESKQIKVTFPKEYHTAELAEKEATFDVTVNELKAVVLPELEQAFAEKYGHSTMEELRAAILQNLHEEKQEQSSREVEEQVVDALVELTKTEVPASLVNQEMDRLFAESRKRLDSMQFEWDTYLKQTGKTPAELKEDMRPQSEKNVKIGLALGKVVQEEGIENGEKAARRAVERLVKIATDNSK